jgi:hypothetical protein
MARCCLLRILSIFSLDTQLQKDFDATSIICSDVMESTYQA